MDTLDSLDSQIVAHVHGNPVTRGTLSKYFDLVADKANWKNPIDRTLVLTPTGREIVRQAIIFFTGSVPTIERTRWVQGHGEFRIRAAGYYLTIGA